jgi:methyl-accepting chemotaxis protein/methyl-accepting chemotaxis protein-1 (serine sensor receptor)
VKTLVDEVNLGSEEQVRGIEQIGKAITQMEQVTQKTAASAEESASAAEELNAQSETLKEVAERLTDMVGGGETTHRRAHPTVEPSRQPNKRPVSTRAERASGSSLRALSAATKRQMRPAESPEPVYAARGTNKDSFPLDDQFKEF